MKHRWDDNSEQIILSIYFFLSTSFISIYYRFLHTDVQWAGRKNFKELKCVYKRFRSKQMKITCFPSNLQFRHPTSSLKIYFKICSGFSPWWLGFLKGFTKFIIFFFNINEVITNFVYFFTFTKNIFIRVIIFLENILLFIFIR